MIYPPIDKVIQKVNCKYALVVLVAKRAHQLVDKKPDMIEESEENVLTLAATEVYDGTVFAHFED